MKTTINYKGVELEIEFYHEKETKGDYITPSTHEAVTINEISHDGKDFTDLLENQFNEIENLILENLN